MRFLEAHFHVVSGLASDPPSLNLVTPMRIWIENEKGDKSTRATHADKLREALQGIERVMKDAPAYHQIERIILKRDIEEARDRGAEEFNTVLGCNRFCKLKRRFRLVQAHKMPGSVVFRHSHHATGAATYIQHTTLQGGFNAHGSVL